MSAVDNLKKEIQNLASLERAKASLWFFKTGPGQYGAGDQFAGLTVPQSRQIAGKYKDLDLAELEVLLNSKIHEERLIALIILVNQFKKADEEKKKEIFEFYLAHTDRINNWDLVDTSASQIVGGYLVNHDKKILLKLAKSSNLWEKRISIIATAYFISRQKDPTWTFKIAELLLNDPHDLIHKAVGWMLREVGKYISQEVEEEFLKKYYQRMPRTMLRYSLEHFDAKKRAFYMKK